MIHQWNLTIPPLTGDEPRRAYVYLPDSFQEDPSLRYPVLYMFDGHNVFFDEDATYGKSWGLGNYLDAAGTQIMVAAVECNHHPDNGRLSEYSPFTFRTPQTKRVVGRGRITMEWLTRAFKPGIDRDFPTLPGRESTFIAGSSMGGLMSLYALLAYNHVFSRAAALSPSLWVSPSRVESLIRSSQVDPDTALYLDYGSEELNNHPQQLRLLGRAASLLTEKRIGLDFRIIPGGEHCEASWERQIPFFIHALLYGRDCPAPSLEG